MLDIPPRYMWGWSPPGPPTASGYCGSASVQSTALYFGNWITQMAVRDTSGGHDAALASKIVQRLGGHARLSATSAQKVRGQFAVCHYAGLVVYTVAGFVEKNSDKLMREAVELLAALASASKSIAPHQRRVGAPLSIIRRFFSISQPWFHQRSLRKRSLRKSFTSSATA